MPLGKFPDSTEYNRKSCLGRSKLFLQYKILAKEEFMHNIFTWFISEKKLYSKDSASGFHDNHLTYLVLMELIEDITVTSDKQMVTAVVYIDLNWHLIEYITTF